MMAHVVRSIGGLTRRITVTFLFPFRSAYTCMKVIQRWQGWLSTKKILIISLFAKFTEGAIKVITIIFIIINKD